MVMSDVIHLFHDGVIEQSGSPVEVYTKPETTFAAGFIGNYNILDANAMEAITGKKWNSGQFAIRPETFLLSKDTITTEDYRMNGTIIDYVPRGNVLRYHIDINGVEVYADVLFRSMSMFNVGEKINVGVADHNCVRL